MKRTVTSLAAAVTIALTASGAEPGRKDCPPPPPGFPRFQWQEIGADFKIGYAVHIADVNGDAKPDIVVVDKDRVVWYENPTWKLRTILKGKTKPDNVCICSVKHKDQICFVLGAGWKPFDTKTPGTLQWLQRGKSLDDEWEMYPIPCDEPMVHRVKFADILWNNKQQIIMAPLIGLGATKENNWMDGRPVRILTYEVPVKPTDASAWKHVVIDESMHVVHNFYVFDNLPVIMPASYEGISTIDPSDNRFNWILQHAGNQQSPKGSRGCSEVTRTTSKMFPGGLVATIDPWHGNEVAIYYRTVNPKGMHRRVIDSDLRWGHAIHFLKPKEDEEPFLVAGVRDNPDPKQGDTFTEKRGVRLYRATDAKGEKWERYILEDGAVAVEDLAVADLNGDGRPDIVAVGRATQNCRIYWNKGK